MRIMNERRPERRGDEGLEKEKKKNLNNVI